MRIACRLLALLGFLVCGLPCINAQRVRLLLDNNWRFHRGDAPGAEAPGQEDKGWRTVDLPHDWSIEDLPGTDSPFDSTAVNGVSEGFTTGGTGWYRKTFTMPSDSKGKSCTLLFEGVYMDADVWLNGTHLGNHPYGYTSFEYNIGAQLRYGQPNVLAVRVRNIGATSRWYPGSGIYRHVWLQITAPLHVGTWGTYIRTQESGGHRAVVRVRTTLNNEGANAQRVLLRTRLLDPAGRQVAVADTGGVTVGPGDSLDLEQVLRVQAPERWSCGHPSMYKAVTEVLGGERIIDRTTTKFGIRTITMDAIHGFQVNGRPIKLKGGCFHDDHGPLGSKSYDRAEERRVQLLLASGYNAIRCSHNPPAPAFLDACDRLGLLVIDEAFDCWEDGKNPQDYHLYFDDWWQRDIHSMVFRDRNHPSIILWSIGNEIPNMDSPRVAAMAKTLADYVHVLEPTRGVIAAVNGPSEEREPFIQNLNVAGYNYSQSWSDWYTADHQRHPDRVMLATESFPLQAYLYWKAVENHPYVIGDFVWTAWDYIGEASIGWRGYPQEKSFYPWNLAFCGDIDVCGWKRPASYFRDALWHNGENVSIFVEPATPTFPLNPHRADWSMWNWFDVVHRWNWAGEEGKPLKVVVYSSCPEAELFLNGRSLGRHPVDSCKATWSVPYEKGTLQAIAYRGGKPVQHADLKTAGAPVRIRLTADRKHIKSGGEDLSYVTVELVDAAGVRDPTAANLMHFSVSGPGAIVGVGNANPISTESYERPQRQCWEGRCLVVLRSGQKGGVVRLRVSSLGLQSNEVLVNVD